MILWTKANIARLLFLHKLGWWFECSLHDSGSISHSGSIDVQDHLLAFGCQDSGGGTDGLIHLKQSILFCLKQSFKAGEMGSMGWNACLWAWWPVWDPQIPQGSRREPAPKSSPLTVLLYARWHTYMPANTDTLNKKIKAFIKSQNNAEEYKW